MRLEKKTEPPEPLTADEIADLADSGEDVARFFTGSGKMMPPVRPDERKPIASYTKYDIVDQ
jgi:hypothetical protein